MPEPFIVPICGTSSMTGLCLPHTRTVLPAIDHIKPVRYAVRAIEATMTPTRASSHEMFEIARVGSARSRMLSNPHGSGPVTDNRSDPIQPVDSPGKFLGLGLTQNINLLFCQV